MSLPVLFHRLASVTVCVFAAAAPALLLACRQAPPPATPAPRETAAKAVYPPRPTVAAPPVKLFHQDEDTLTLTTIPDATDDQVAAILWGFRDANRTHGFAALHLPQAFVDARKPKVWFHVYRGPRCAAEKFIHGTYPCGASYHGAGDYTLGGYSDPLYEEGVLRHADGSETRLWDPEAHATKP